MKRFIAGVLTGLILATSVSAFAAESRQTIDAVFDRVRLVVNGVPSDAQTLLCNGSTYLQLRPAAAALGANLAWDAATNTATLTTGTLVAAVDNPNPAKNQSVNLLVSGAGYGGKTYTAQVFYKTTSTSYTGVVGQPCAIKVSSATPDWRVQVVVTLDSGEQTVTSFTPKQ